MRKLLLLLTVLFLIFVSPAMAQDSGEEQSGAAQKNDKDTLFYRTLVRDIETASYTELVEWCRTVGVPENGDSDVLKKRLMDYFEVQSQPPEKKSGDTFIIRSSDKTRYFNVEKADENYVTISGGVTLEVNEEKDNALHQIQADKLVYNQKRQLMTAEGNVIYTRKVKDKEEKYFGDKLSFDLEDWSGVFFQGIFPEQPVFVPGADDGGYIADFRRFPALLDADFVGPEDYFRGHAPVLQPHLQIVHFPAAEGPPQGAFH